MRTPLINRGIAARLHRGPLAFLGAATIALAMLGSSVPNVAGASASSPVTINEYNNGHTVTLSVGQHATVVLHSTYWSIATLGSTRPLNQLGAAVYAPRLPSAKGGCVAGQGCGTVSVHYVASAPGIIHLHASRTSCGEALRCTPALSHWAVTIRVR